MMLERHQGRLAGKRVLLEFGGNDCNLNWEQISKEKEAPVTAQADLEVQKNGQQSFGLQGQVL